MFTISIAAPTQHPSVYPQEMSCWPCTQIVPPGGSLLFRGPWSHGKTCYRRMAQLLPTLCTLSCRWQFSQQLLPDAESAGPPMLCTLRLHSQFLKQLPPEKQTERKMTRARMRMMSMTMSHIFLCCHHILRRSATPVRWNRSAWLRRLSVLSTRFSIRSPRASTCTGGEKPIHQLAAWSFAAGNHCIAVDLHAITCQLRGNPSCHLRPSLCLHVCISVPPTLQA